MSGPAVALEQVFRVHRSAEGDAVALQGLTLSVAAGEMVCVIGPSGAGKSTLLRVVAGIDTPSAGDVLVLGRELGRLPIRLRARIRRDHIGVLGQNWSSVLSPELPLRDAVALPLMLRRVRAREARMRAMQLLDSAGLRGRESARAHELSGGERQRAAVCVALAHRPALLLADEPTGELDRASAGLVRALIRELAQAEGASVILVSHDGDTATEANRTLRMRDGRIEAELGRDGEFRLIDARGWVRLPSELLGPADIGDRVQIRRAEAGLLVSSGSDGSPRVASPGSAGPSPVPSGAGESESEWTAARVELRAVAREHRDGASTRVVLNRFSCGFEPRQLTVVTGRSGAGKSTLLRLIAGLEVPDGGEILIDGQTLPGADGERLATLRRERIGYLSQDPFPVGFLSARENIILALAWRGVTPAVAAVRAEAALTWVGLAERAGQRVSRLSAGESQRVALARALACARGLLILDEPTSRLDEPAAVRVGELLEVAVRGRGHTVIAATHDEQLIARADAIVTLSG